MQNELIESVSLEEVKGIPSFIFTTQQVDKLKELFELFPLTILTVDVPMLRSLPTPEQMTIPDNASLRIEFSLDDIHPGDVLWDMYIDVETRQRMTQLNLRSKRINIGIREKYTEKLIAVPGRQYPYIVDWTGIGGLTLMLCLTHDQQGRELPKNLAQTFIKTMNEDSIDRYGGYVTALHAQMGLLYRRLGDFKKAKQCYMQEVKGAQRSDGSFTMSAMLGFNNMAVIHKKLGEHQPAILNFKLALALHPNYFQALVSIAGFFEPQQSMSFLARAYRIQSGSPIWDSIFFNLANAYKVDAQQFANQVYENALKIDLESPIVDPSILKKVELTF